MAFTILEIPQDEETDELYYIYFLKNTLGDILYIGKTTRLRARIRQHLVGELVKLESWRETVDRNNIATIRCINACDMDLYETYFINKYKPIYNKEKIFNSCPTFDFPYIEPIIYKFNLKYIVGNGSFKDNCIKYIEDEESREYLGEKYPLIKDAYENLGRDKIRALAYSIDKIREELHYVNIKNQGLIKKDIYEKVILQRLYTYNELKKIVNDIYKKYNITKKGKASDIKDYVLFKSKSVRQGKDIVSLIETISFI